MSRFARRLDGVRVAFNVTSGDRPVLLVHGFAANASATWEKTGWVQALSQAGRATITPDLRGHGQSDKPTRAPDYTSRQVAADLVAVLDELQLERVDVIGYSMGCRVVAALARLVPERLHRLVLGGAGPIELFDSWNLEQVSRYVHDGTVPADPTIAAVLGPALAEGGDAAALLACVAGFAGSTLEVPTGLPQLFVGGGADAIVAGVSELAAARGAEYLELPGRTHHNTLTSSEFKRAALAFLA